MTDLPPEAGLDPFTQELFDTLYAEPSAPHSVDTETLTRFKAEIQKLRKAADAASCTAPITALFDRLLRIRTDTGLTPTVLGVQRSQAIHLAQRHAQTDEHGVTVGGRINRALPIVQAAESRVKHYMAQATAEAPSGLELWDTLEENARRIQSLLHMTQDDWNSYSGQLRHCIGSVEMLSKIIDLPSSTISEVARVTEQYRMRLTPYYASLIRSGRPNDPVLLQSVPTSEMVDSVGEEMPPVAADHSPARLIDVPLTAVGWNSCGGAATLNINDNAGNFSHNRIAQCFLHQRETWAAGGSHHFAAGQ